MMNAKSEIYLSYLILLYIAFLCFEKIYSFSFDVTNDSRLKKRGR